MTFSSSPKPVTKNLNLNLEVRLSTMTGPDLNGLPVYPLTRVEYPFASQHSLGVTFSKVFIRRERPQGWMDDSTLSTIRTKLYTFHRSD